MFKCSVPNCNHIAYTILNKHYIEHHAMTKKKAKSLYGPEQYLKTKHKNITGLVSSLQKSEAIVRKMKKRFNR